MPVYPRHVFHARMAQLIRSWSKALCDETNALNNLPDLNEPIIRRFYTHNHFPLFFTSLRVAVEVISSYQLTIREPHPFLLESTEVSGGSSTFIVCRFNAPEGRLDTLPAGARSYHFDDGYLQPVAVK